MRTGVLLLFCLLAPCSYAFLDKIDADGVTEKGGSPEYARMLPRTKADGVLDKSLLPPVADWASVPIPGLYYVASGAAPGGNGSPQYPYGHIREAVASATPGAAAVIAPGEYEDTFRLSGGTNATLCGFGYVTYVKRLSVTVSGSSELRLCGIRVGTLSVSGGRVTVRLSGATVGMLDNATSAVSVKRADLGSYIQTATAAYSDAYVGYDIIDKALHLVSSSGESLEFRNGRPSVGSDYVAYLSDVAAATNSLCTSVIKDLQDEDIRLLGLIDTERTERTAADFSLSNDVSSVLSNMNDRISEIDRGWNTRLETLSANVSRIGSSLGALSIQETNDVRILRGEIAEESRKAESDNASLKTTLQSEIAASVSGLRDDIPGIADSRALVQIAAERPGIVNEAVEKSYAHSDATFAAISNQLKTLTISVSSLNATSRVHSAGIESLKAADTTLAGRIKSLGDKEASDVLSLQNRIAGVRTDFEAADTRLKSELRVEIGNVESSISSIADTRADLAIRTARPGIIDDAVDAAKPEIAVQIAPVSARVTALGARVTTAETNISQMSTRISGVESNISSLKTRINTLEGDVERKYGALSDRIAALETWKEDADDRIDALTTRCNLHRDKVNDILAVLRQLKAGTPWSGITVPDNLTD